MPDVPLLPQPTPPVYFEPKVDNKTIEPLNSTGKNFLEGAILKVRRVTIKGQIDG